MSTPKHPEIVVRLSDRDGNAFAILSRVTAALRAHDVEPEPFIEDATSGDYNNLLAAAGRWVTVE